MFWSDKFISKFRESIGYINDSLFFKRKRVDFIEESEELPSPFPRLQLRPAFKKKVKSFFEEQGCKVVGVTDTNSMDSWIDAGHYAIFCSFGNKFPFRKKDLCVGDVIAFYRRLDNTPLVLHRIVETQHDEGYVVTRGDNTVMPDGAVRHEDILYYCGGVIYG